MAQRNRPPVRRGLPSWFSLVTLSVIVVSAGLVGLLVWSQIEVQQSRKPMLGPGTFMDATQTYVFEASEGWEVFHSRSQTRVEKVDGLLPAYELELRDMSQMNLVVNWNCPLLPDLIPNVIQAIGPQQAAITFVSVPCAANVAEPVHARVYLTLADGRSQVFVFGPIDGVSWLVARTVPFSGQSSADLVQAMVTSVTTGRRR